MPTNISLKFAVVVFGDFLGPIESSRKGALAVIIVVVELLLDELGQVFWLRVGGGRLLDVSVLGDLGRDLDRAIPDVVQRRVQPAHGQVGLGDDVGQAFGRRQEYIVRDVSDAGADDPQGHSWEDVGVVALAGLEGLAVHVECRERRSGGEDGAAFGGLVGLLGGAFGLRGRVRQGEDHGSLVERGHVFEDLFGKHSADGGRSCG